MDHLGVIREEQEAIFGKDYEQDGKDDGRAHGDLHADLDARLHAVVFPGPVVLAHEGHDRHAERDDEGPVDAVHLAGGRPGGHGVRAQVVDGDLN